MEKHKYPMQELDDLQVRMSCAIKTLGAVHEVIENGANEPSSYADALFGTYDYLWSLNTELRECIDSLFEARKQAGVAV